jgi:Transposase IS66 family
MNARALHGAICIDAKSPIAEAAVRQIAALYGVEATVGGSSPEVRLAARREHSAPIIAALKPWLEKQLSRISSGSPLAEDIRYGLPAKAVEDMLSPDIDGVDDVRYSGKTTLHFWPQQTVRIRDHSDRGLSAFRNDNRFPALPAYLAGAYK